MLLIWCTFKQIEVRFNFSIRNLELFGNPVVDRQKIVVASDPRSNDLACSYLNNYSNLNLKRLVTTFNDNRQELSKEL